MSLSPLDKAKLVLFKSPEQKAVERYVKRCKDEIALKLRRENIWVVFHYSEYRVEIYNLTRWNGEFCHDMHDIRHGEGDSQCDAWSNLLHNILECI